MATLCVELAAGDEAVGKQAPRIRHVQGAVISDAGLPHGHRDDHAVIGVGL